MTESFTSGPLQGFHEDAAEIRGGWPRGVTVQPGRSRAQAIGVCIFADLERSVTLIIMVLTRWTATLGAVPPTG
jgi:hypothetical protein